MLSHCHGITFMKFSFFLPIVYQLGENLYRCLKTFIQIFLLLGMYDRKFIYCYFNTIFIVSNVIFSVIKRKPSMSFFGDNPIVIA